MMLHDISSNQHLPYLYSTSSPLSYLIMDTLCDSLLGQDIFSGHANYPLILALLYERHTDTAMVLY